MGLFSKKISLNGVALNIDCWGKKTFYLETFDGYITRENYLPENMEKVTAFLVGGDPHKNNYDTRIGIDEVTEFEVTPKLQEPASKLTELFGLKHPFSLVIKTSSKKYSFEVIGDVCGKDELAEIVNANCSEEERYAKLIEASCIYRLSDICCKD